MSERITLKGITWNHSRGFVPMVATAQRFTELNPSVEIIWEKRSLQQFADFSIEELAKRFDLLVIDHPWAGFAAQTRSIVPLDEYLTKGCIQDQRQHSVGRSFESYSYNGHQWALAIDAATPVASSRPDLFEKYGLELPKTFKDLMELAEQGLVAFAGIPIDALMSFYMFCCSLGEDPCQQEEQVVSTATGIKALALFRELASKIHPDNFHRNPIQVYEAMTKNDQIAYCPFAYGYSNYSRRGYARKLLHFHDLVSLEEGGTNLKSTLGGTGLAVSSSSENISLAVQYANFVASGECQQSVFFENGGQPGHLSAWQDKENNRQTHNYFANTLPALERAFLRPRYHGHMFFQDHAGDIVRDYLMNGGNEEQVLEKMNSLYRESRNLQLA